MTSIQPVHEPRQSRLDFLKLLLVLLVIAGHVIERYSLGQGQVIYRWLYLFHMPAFIFLSGMFSHALLDARGGQRLLATVVLPLIVHQLALKGLDAYWFNRPFALGLSVPYWALWYLMSLLLWRLLLPLIMGTPHPLLLAITLSLAAGWFKDFGYAWSLSRTLVYLPFFVAGHLYAIAHGRTLPPTTPGRLLQATAILFALLGIAWSTQQQHITWLYASFAYADFASSALQGVGWRSLQLLAGAAGIFAILRMALAIPGISPLGQYSMAIFISHIYLLKLAESHHWFALLPQHGFTMRIAMVAACSLACTAIGVTLGRWLPQLFDFSWVFSSRRNTQPQGAASGPVITSATQQ